LQTFVGMPAVVAHLITDNFTSYQPSHVAGIQWYSYCTAIRRQPKKVEAVKASTYLFVWSE